MSNLARLTTWSAAHANVLLVSALAVVCVVVGFATGFWLLCRLAYLIALAIPLTYLWSRSMIRDLRVEVTRRTHRVTQGQPLTGQIIMRSTGWLPKGRW